MKTICITVKNWEKYRRPLTNFVKRYEKKYGEHYSWIYHLRKHQLNNLGTKVKIALWEGKVVAVFAFLNYGTTDSLILISPSYQQTHIGVTLLKGIIEELGVCYTKLSYEQPALIKLALNAGMVAFAYTSEMEDQKMKLWLGGGQWHINDINEKEASSE